MTTFTLKTKNSAIVSIEISNEQIFAFLNAEVKKLQEKLDSYNVMDLDTAGELAVKSLRTKVNGIEKAGKLEKSYTYTELKKRTAGDGNQFKAYLRKNGIEETLLNSAERAMKEGLKALEYLKIALVTDKERIKLAVLNAVKGKDSAWHELTINWLLDDDIEQDAGQELAEA